MSNRVTIVIPSRNEQFLPHTIKDLLKNARGDIEIIAVLDGYWPPSEQIVNDPRVKYLHRGEPRGMRNGITSAVEIATGKYILKIDAHCMVSEGFDEVLKAHCENNWVVIPRRKRLDAENWCIQDVGKPDIDYEYLSFPDNPSDFGGPGFNGRIWTERILERLDKPEYDIDDNMSFQGSCWFMTKEHFKNMELMDEVNYGPFWSEAQEIGFKTFLSGGSVKVNKKAWYAHLHKGKKYGRGYRLTNRTVEQGAMFSSKWVHNNAWAKQTLPFHTMIEKFWPVPGWPENWKEVLNYDDTWTPLAE